MRNGMSVLCIDVLKRSTPNLQSEINLVFEKCRKRHAETRGGYDHACVDEA